MDEKSKCDLPYGHYGRAEYRPDNHKWDFERRPNDHASLKVLESANAVNSACDEVAPNYDEHLPITVGKQHEQQIKALVESHPEFCPATSLLGAMLRTSKAVQRAAQQYDPVRHGLIAFTSVRSPTRHRSVPIAAFASGKAGCTLRIVRMQTQQQGWADEKDCWLEVPILQGEDISWPTNHGPIEQIVFTPTGRNFEPLVVIRLPTRTQLLRPSLGTASKTSATTSSSLSLDLLYSFDIEDAGGIPHADVACNPWFPQQFGFIDQAGHWSVFEFDSRRLDHVSRVCHGDIRTHQNTGSSVLCDGWARMAWICDVSTIAVCSRQHLVVFTAAHEPVKLGDIELGLTSTAPWILDFSISPVQSDSVLVLTSTHIIMFRLSTRRSFGELHQHTLFNARHFMNAEDLSLRMSVWKDEDETIGLVLYSSSNTVLTFYRLEIGEGGLVHCHDPLGLQMLTAVDDPRQKSSIASLLVRPLSLQRKKGRSAGTQSSSLGANARFYQFTIFRTENSIDQQLVCHSSNAGPCGPSWSKISQRATSLKLRSENFVAEDSEEAEHDTALTRDHPPWPRRLRPRKPEPAPGIALVDFTAIVESLHLEQPRSRGLDEIVSDIEAALTTKWAEVPPPIRTLYDFTSSEIIVSDVQHASKQLDGAILKHRDAFTIEPADEGFAGQHLRQKVEGVPLPLASNLCDHSANGQLSSIYDELVSAWISPLSPRIPGWVRLAKVGIARCVAAELALATQVVRIETVTEAPAEKEPQSPTQTWRLPVRPAEYSSQAGPTAAFPATRSSQVSALPTPSPTATPSVTTASGASSYVAPEMQRLSRFTTFARSAPAILPRALNNVLNHWRVGEDPEEYDWLFTARRINEQDEDQGEEMTEHERRRMHRRAERHIRKQRREAAASQAQQLASSQAPEIVSASQPVLKVESQPVNLVGSSQTQTQHLASSAVTASQVAPGRYGGRPPRKKRKQGF